MQLLILMQSDNQEICMAIPSLPIKARLTCRLSEWLHFSQCFLVVAMLLNCLEADSSANAKQRHIRVWDEEELCNCCFELSCLEDKVY
jgi:hypothetical protein